MAEHTIYSDSVLTVTARPTAVGTAQARWIVRFVRRAPSGRKMLDQCAAWAPERFLTPIARRWDPSRWNPTNTRLVPVPVLARVERWLEGRPVEGKP